MAHDPVLAERMRRLLAAEPGITEKRMFGGLAFLLNGNMAVSASGQGGLLVHVDPATGGTLLREPHVEPMVMRGRAMEGWLRVGAGAVSDDRSLRRWVARGVDYARTLPPK